MDSALALPGRLDLSSLLPKEDPLALGFGDDDYEEAPKFTVAETRATVDELKADHSVRIAQSKEYCHFMDAGTPGSFAEDEGLIEDGIMETFPLLGAREDYEFRLGFLAMHDPYPRLLNRDARDRDEAMAVEDLVIHDFACAERQYERHHLADMRIAKAAHLQRYGMLCGLNVLDPEDQTCGLAMDLLDPLTVFPVWGGPSGVVEVYRLFEATNEEIIGAYGGKPGTKEYARIRALVEKSATKTRIGRKNHRHRNQRRTVVEAWNPDHQQVILDEEVELLHRTHGYREVPIVIQVGAFDQPMGTSIGTQWENMREPTVKTNWGDVSVSDASMDLARQLRPYAWRHLWAHRIAEAVAGRRLSMFKWTVDPATVEEYDPSQLFRRGEDASFLPGTRNRMPIPNKLTIVTPVVDPNTMAGLAADLQSNVGAGFLTQMRLGAIPPQTSGSAMAKMAAMGGAGDYGLIKTLTAFDRRCAEARLELRLHFGDSIGTGGELGIFATPARAGADTPLHFVTPEMLKRTGTQIDIELFRWEPDVALAQYVTSLRTPSPTTGKPLISDQTAHRLLKFVADTEREADRIDDEALSAVPPIQQQRHKRRLERDLNLAMDDGDDSTAADIMTAIQELEFLHERAMMEGTASPAPSGGQGTQANMVPSQPPQSTPNLPGTSLTEQGIGVGQEGGAPGAPGQMGGGMPPEALTPLTPVTGGR
jgi:hypothetical protein